MPLLLNNEYKEKDNWHQYDDDASLPENRENAVISLERWLKLNQDNETTPNGVSIAPADDIHLLAPFIESLKLICIEFPVYTDGRGYSHARVLRKRFNYTNELRAVGDIRADQILFMQRLGINSFDSNTLPDAKLLREVLGRFEHNYQPSYPLPLN